MKSKILVADDDESVRKMVARVLELGGYGVMLAGTGDEAVAKYRSARPDLVLLDLKVPGREGWAVFEEISRINALAPAIIITSWPNQYEHAVRRGVDALMEKPLDLPLLLQTIQGLLAESEQERTQRLTDRNFTTVHLAQASGVGSLS